MLAGGGPAAGCGVAGAALAVLPGVPRHGRGGEEEESEGCHGDCREQTGQPQLQSDTGGWGTTGSGDQ